MTERSMGLSNGSGGATEVPLRGENESCCAGGDVLVGHFQCRTIDFDRGHG